MIHIKLLSQSTYIVNISDDDCLVKTHRVWSSPVRSKVPCSSAPGEDLVPEPPGQRTQNQQEEAPAAGLLHDHAHTSGRHQRQRRRRPPWKRREQRCYGDEQQRQQRAGVALLPAFEHQRGVLRRRKMFDWTLVSGTWTKNSPRQTEKNFLHHFPALWQLPVRHF